MSATQRVLGANDRIQVGFIGYGLIGSQHVHDFKNQPDVDIVGLSDCYEPRLRQGVAACGPRAKGYSDFRRLLDDKDVQAVVISTPDHWHALLTILACAAGKDVYVEKPMTLFVREGRWMVKAAQRYHRVVQVGTQQRSGAHYAHARDLMHRGHIGKIHTVRMGAFRNIMPGFGSPPDSNPPPGMDYNMWLGPAPKRPYNPHRSLYHFRWFWDYSGGQMTNLGAHELDIVHWTMGITGPGAAASSGGRLALTDDNGETPDTQDALFEFPHCTALWSHREASRGRGAGEGLEFFGTKGSLFITRGGFEVYPDTKVPPQNHVPQFHGMPVGGPTHVAGVKPVPWTEAVKESRSNDLLAAHARNFLDCIKSRRPTIAPVEDGHRVATTCHLANISLRLGRKIKWDVEKEEIVGDAEASSWLERPYRAPWDQEFRSLKL
ncbi:MAG TPA: Gfo/Idh/MocA family oxidoreductase [Terriglobia bacterium]|nr:Gfo/Idh/MocA family oxidoreductase [Terriglobia bacterium]